MLPWLGHAQGYSFGKLQKTKMELGDGKGYSLWDWLVDGWLDKGYSLQDWLVDGWLHKGHSLWDWLVNGLSLIHI